jgi:serine/threonine-protein kinase RsbW
MTFIADRSGDPATANPVTGTVGADGRWESEAGEPDARA